MGWGYVVSAIVGVGSAVQSNKQGKAAAQERDKQREAQKGMQDLELRKQRLDARRQARAARATALATGEAQGAAGSSSVEGAVSSIGIQAASQQSFLTQQSGYQNTIFNSQNAESGFSQKASMWSAVNSLSGMGMKTFGGPPKGKATTGAGSQSIYTYGTSEGE